MRDRFDVVVVGGRCAGAPLAALLASALHHADRGVDETLSRWGRWRDREFAEHYWFANDLGAAGSLPAVVSEVLAQLRAQGKAHLVLEINNHRLRPSQLLTPL